MAEPICLLINSGKSGGNICKTCIILRDSEKIYTIKIDETSNIYFSDFGIVFGLLAVGVYRLTNSFYFIL